MGIVYSGHEVIEMGVQIEQKGFDFYMLLARRAKTSAFKQLYSWLADQEKQHIIIFENLRHILDNSLLDGPYTFEEVSLYFRALIDSKVFPNNDDGNMLSDELNDEIGAIQIAITFEKDNILFFQEVRNMVDNEDRSIIDKLIEEEKTHIKQLLAIKLRTAA
jgi:rubrerythrin